MTQTVQSPDLLRDIDDYQRRIEVLERVSLDAGGGDMEVYEQVAEPDTNTVGALWLVMPAT